MLGAVAVVLAVFGGVLTQPLVFAVRSTPPPVDPARREAHERVLSERGRISASS
jgi:hypothetical protein